MKITILSLFPNVFDDYINSSIIKRAIEQKIVEIELCNFREYSKSKHKKVDDTPYGGGAGMVLLAQPIVDAIKNLKTKDSKVILLTPSGIQYEQNQAVKFSLEKHIILICGHYEGFDERILNYVDYQLSIGDYILTGGEIPAMVVLDSIVRLLPNVIDSNSLLDESFNDYLLDYPVYTKPYDFEGHKVPDILLSGNHQKINEFRFQQRIEKTKLNRKDLYNKFLKTRRENNNE